MAKSPTILWCENCRALRPCPYAHYHDQKTFMDWLPQILPSGSERHWASKKYPDVRWVRRVRQCSVCETIFATSEVDETTLIDLLMMKKSYEETKKHLEASKHLALNACRELQKVRRILNPKPKTEKPAASSSHSKSKVTRSSKPAHRPSTGDKQEQ